MKFLIAAAVAATAVAGTTPTFAQEWSSFIVGTLLQDQNSLMIGDNWCCSPSAGQCQIQYQASGSMTYFSMSQNATSSVYGADSTPYAIVTLYNQGGEYAVDSTGACTSYCPLDGATMTPFGVDGYVDMGATTVNGRHVELWQDVTQFPIGNITMETDNFYVDQSNINNAVPVIDIDNLTPFGTPIGQSNTTYNNWKVGKPPASVFNVTGIASCPVDKNCNSNSNTNNARVLHRLRTDKPLFWAQYYKNEAAQAREEGQRLIARADAIKAAQKY